MHRAISRLSKITAISVVLLATQVGYASSVRAKDPFDSGRAADSNMSVAQSLALPRLSAGSYHAANENGDPGRVARRHGEIVFDRVVDAGTGNTAIYTVNPSGRHTHQLFSNPNGAELPHWSPDGRHVSIFCCGDGMAAHIVTRDTGAFRELAAPDPTLEVHCGWWSSDGERLACESFGLTEPSRTGIWTIRASDGGGLTQITSDAAGDDIPGDFSPHGRRLVFVRNTPDGRVGIFVVTLRGGTPRRVTPAGMLIDEEFGGSWSPKGNNILFVARTDADHRRQIWRVHADGSSLHRIRMTPACGGAKSDPTSRGCADPSWSPDGRRIAFSRSNPSTSQNSIYTVDADGSHLRQVTRGGLGDGHPDWGRTPLPNIK